MKSDGPRYQPFYCEENIWHLAQDPRVGPGERRVALISNTTRTVALWMQRAADEPGLPIVWDYHVILLAEARGWHVWDLDTLLPCPLPAAAYLAATFAGARELPACFAPRFRVVDADSYVRALCSDRSHMRDRDQGYREPPPPWPCIGAPGAAPNLFRYVDMDEPFDGEIMDLAGFRAAFG